MAANPYNATLLLAALGAQHQVVRIINVRDLSTYPSFSPVNRRY